MNKFKNAIKMAALSTGALSTGIAVTPAFAEASSPCVSIPGLEASVLHMSVDSDGDSMVVIERNGVQKGYDAAYLTNGQGESLTSLQGESFDSVVKGFDVKDIKVDKDGAQYLVGDKYVNKNDLIKSAPDDALSSIYKLDTLLQGGFLAISGACQQNSLFSNGEPIDLTGEVGATFQPDVVQGGLQGRNAGTLEDLGAFLGSKGVDLQPASGNETLDSADTLKGVEETTKQITKTLEGFIIPSPN